jgi:hypothetical protein
VSGSRGRWSSRASCRSQSLEAWRMGGAVAPVAVTIVCGVGAATSAGFLVTVTARRSFYLCPLRSRRPRQLIRRASIRPRRAGAFAARPTTVHRPSHWSLTRVVSSREDVQHPHALHAALPRLEHGRSQQSSPRPKRSKGKRCLLLGRCAYQSSRGARLAVALLQAAAAIVVVLRSFLDTRRNRSNPSCTLQGRAPATNLPSAVIFQQRASTSSSPASCSAADPLIGITSSRNRVSVTLGANLAWPGWSCGPFSSGSGSHANHDFADVLGFAETFEGSR